MLDTECNVHDGESCQNKIVRSETPMESPQAAATPPDDAEDTADYRQSSVNLVDALSEVVDSAKENSFRFLDLPAELRNVIYELCLLEPDRITITPELEQPALLMTCRQIRSETKLMWFWRNTYQYTVTDCDSRLVYAFHGLYGGPLPHKVRVNIYATGQNNWTALMEWCKFIFAHRRHCFRRTTVTQGREVIKAATVLTSQSGAATWRDCKRDLQLLRPLAVCADRQWSKNYRRIKTSKGGYAWLRMLTPSKSTTIPSTT